METTDTAVSLMKHALALLDRDGRGDVACHLQNALDVACKVEPPRAEEDWDLDQEAAFFARMDAVRAKPHGAQLTSVE